MDAAFECNKNRSGGFEYPFYITSLITDSNGFEAPSHWHYHFELLYFQYGSAKVFVGNKCFEVKSGEIALINPCEVHSVLISPEAAVKQFVVGFDIELLNAASNMDFEFKYLLPQAIDINPDYRIVKIGPGLRVDLILEEMNQEYMSKRIGFELSVTSCIYKLITLVLRSLENNGFLLTKDSALMNNNIMKLIKVLNHIDKHYNEDISAASAAEMCYLSYSHFSKLFKGVMHTSFIQYVNNIRIRKAESLLLDGDKSITQIALETGFTDVSYFIKQFREYKGVSPKQYQGLLIHPDKKGLRTK